MGKTGRGKGGALVVQCVAYGPGHIKYDVIVYSSTLASYVVVFSAKVERSLLSFIHY